LHRTFGRRPAGGCPAGDARPPGPVRDRWHDEHLR
jgi:hypothetical protein